MQKIIRLIDANINRCQEALRVIEDINRFIIDDKRSSLALKNIRHNFLRFVDKLPLKRLDRLAARDISSDVGRSTSRSESARKNYLEIYYRNIQRAKESLRVLEEFSKIYDGKVSKGFKFLRYKVYDLEKNIFAKG
jgi:thiamine-phosphate pyrophosphorylase